MRSLLLCLVLSLSLVGDSLAGIQMPRTGSPEVEIPGLGRLNGKYGYSAVNNRRFSMFLGFRYAKAPSGDLRFQPPQLYGPWDNVINAHFPGQKCPQLGIARGDFGNWHAALEEMMIEKGIHQELKLKDKEDCLFMHVYTPNVSASLPVMVFFHGGAFAGGSANVYQGARLMDKDVVLVVPHYRLGPLSFLSLQTDEIPGNAGMLDQVLALRWVQRHISAFGGNPNQVTIFGESAGAASVSLLMLSPLAKDLFHRVIAESGSALADWAIDYEPEYNAINIARIAGCDQKNPDGTPDISGITNCLKTVDAMQLTSAYQTYKAQQEIEGRTGFGGCSPVIQRAGSLKFLEHAPETYFKSDYHKVPILSGSNRDEGTYVLNTVYSGHMVPNNLVNDTDFLKYRMTDVALKLFNTRDPNYWIVDAIEEHYEPKDAKGDFYKLMPALIDILGATFLKGPTYRVVQYNSKYEDSYHYTFNYNGTKSFWPVMVGKNLPFPGGVCHANELIYIFSIPLFDLVSDTDKIVSSRMVDLWTNFATYGNPTPDESPVEGVPTWPKFNENEKPYLQIKEDFTIEHDFTKQYSIEVDEGMIFD